MLKCMIADDEKIIRETIASSIPWQALGLDLIGVCKNGLEAPDVIIDENPDLCLIDIRMPGLSGLELIERAHAFNPEICFIILSGYGEFEYARKAMLYGVRHYLLKPSHPRQLIDVLSQTAEECRNNKKRRGVQYAPAHASCHFIEQCITYTRTHYQDPDLTLKWIAENQLFMNVDYVSKQFLRQTGERYSAFLNRIRIEQAVSLLQEHSYTIYEIAQRVGYGNNPQYFSQVFRKFTGLTPTAYLQQL